jgi:hypothetical protein
LLVGGLRRALLGREHRLQQEDVAEGGNEDEDEHERHDERLNHGTLQMAIPTVRQTGGQTGSRVAKISYPPL